MQLYRSIGQDNTRVHLYDTCTNTWERSPDLFCPPYFRPQSIQMYAVGLHDQELTLRSSLFAARMLGSKRSRSHSCKTERGLKLARRHGMNQPVEFLFGETQAFPRSRVAKIDSTGFGSDMLSE